MNLFDSILKMHPETDKRNGVYETAYEESFLQHRDRIKLLFEIGVYHGDSLRTFRDYFSNALIVGIDINPVRRFADDRIVVEIGDATDMSFMAEVIKKHGVPDIVVDDGSHSSQDIKSAFNFLYPLTKFCYVIEDLNTQYAKFENGRFIKDGVPAVSIIHENIDDLLCNRTTASVRCYHAICFLFKP